MKHLFIVWIISISFLLCVNCTPELKHKQTISKQSTWFECIVTHFLFDIHIFKARISVIIFSFFPFFFCFVAGVCLIYLQQMLSNKISRMTFHFVFPKKNKQEIVPFRFFDFHLFTKSSMIQSDFIWNLSLCCFCTEMKN